MDQDKHDDSGGGRDGFPSPSIDNGARPPTLELETQDQSASQYRNASSIRALEFPSVGNNYAAVSPQSLGAPSYHTASSWKENNDSPNGGNENGFDALGLGFEGEGEHFRKLSTTSRLSVNTNCTTFKTDGSDPRKYPPQPDSPECRTFVPARSPSFHSPTSPISPRTRDCGFSLHSSALERHIDEQAESSGSAIELQLVTKSAGYASPLSSGDGAGHKAETTIAVPSAGEQADAEHGAKSVKKPDAMSSLPHYETWMVSKAARKGLRVRIRAIKEQVRKKILKIRDIPPSKDGRHLQLDPARKKPLVDDRTGNEYIKNTILSSRYTLYNFLPRQLFAQFSKLANFYFLCVSILQMIPGLSTTGTYTTIVPLLFFVMISIAKEGYDDLRRYRLDKAENNRTAYILHARECPTTDSDNICGNTAISGSEHWVETKWRDIRVGDIVKLSRDDAVPADIAVLQATGTEDVAYIETIALDGESNLKSKQASPPLSRSGKSTIDIAKCNAHFVLEDPNLDLYNLEGKVTVGEETLPMTNNEIIYRGSIVRNTSEVTGMVIYTGEECKIRMNATKNPRIKAPALQAVVNKVVIILVVFVILLAVFNTVAYHIWQEDVEESSWYLANAGVAFFPILVSFIILFNTMIPLSLYVSLEIVKLFQMLLLSDIEMYDEASNTPMEARTSTINEDLGQVDYIFSDKTGTLTNNSMRLRKISVAGTAWLHDPDLQEDAIKEITRRPPLQKRRSKGKTAVWPRASTSAFGERLVAPGTTLDTPRSPIRNSSQASHWRSPARESISQPELSTTELIRYVQRRPHMLFSRKVRAFLISVALCHTCFPEIKSNGEIEYQAASPDEQALVRAAQELGYIMVDRRNANITIKTLGTDSEGEPGFEVYQVLDILEFSSNRKRMSIIVRMPNRRICVFCKGADSTLIRLLRLSGLAISKAVEVEQRANNRKSLEAKEVIRRESEARSRKNSVARQSMSIHRPSMSGLTRQSMTANRLDPIRDVVDGWLWERETDVDLSALDNKSVYYSPRPSAQYGPRQPHASLDGGSSFKGEDIDEWVEEALVVDDSAVFERCFQHINDFATEGLRTLLYGYRYIEEEEYKEWKKIYLDASTSLHNRQEMIEKAGAMVERDLELVGATAIEDKLQNGVPEAIDKLRRAKIKLWMLTGDKRETAINIGQSCRLIKDYSTVTILDDELGDVGQSVAAATLEMNNDIVAHSVVVIDGHTLSQITASEPLYELFLSLAILVDTVICCRASPAQKASLVSSIRHKVKNTVTLAIGDGANDIAMIQEAHVGIGITGREGLQAARTSDYSIAQFRFLTKLLLVHGRWNYNRTCKYTLGTFWKEMLFYLTQALYQRWAGYTGTSLYESWSLSMFNTLFTSLPVIFMGIFEQDLTASTLLAVPELYHSLGHHNGGFKIKIYLAWVAMAASQAVVVFFIMLGLYGQALFTTDNGLYAMGDLTFTACIIIIATKMQFWEIHNKTYTCAISISISIGGWFLWNVILSSTYTNNVIYNVKDGFFDRFGRNPLWWLTLVLVVMACWALEVGVKTVKCSWMPSDADVFRQLEKDPAIKTRFEKAAAVGLAAHASYGGSVMHEPGDIRRPVRTAEENKQREGEVQEMLDRPRDSRGPTGTSHEVEIEPRGADLRRRQHSEHDARSPQELKVSFAVADRGIRGNDEDDEEEDMKNREKLKQRSTDVHELLKRGFGSVRRSLDIV